MAKLTDRQRKQIIAEYVDGDGKVSIRKLAEKYGVSATSISKILKDEKSVQKLTDKKEENTKSMLDYLDSRRDAAENLIEIILKTSGEQMESASLRDKMGALKILSEVFGKSKDALTSEARLKEVVKAIKGESDE